MIGRYWKEIGCLSLVAASIIVGCSPAKFSANGNPGTVAPQCVNPGDATCSNTTTTVPNASKVNDYDVTIPQGPNHADILFVIDNSGSMAPLQNQLASRFGKFIDSIKSTSPNLNWRIAITTTDMDNDAPLKNGHLLALQGISGQYVISNSTPNYTQVFANTVMSAGENGSGDERAIFAAVNAVKRNEFSWIRDDGNLTVVILSDEDERSTDGSMSGYPLVTGQDYAEDLTDAVTSKFPNKTLAVDSIVIDPKAPNAQQCLNQMNGANGGSSAFAYQYTHLSALTGGLIGDICSSDYSSALTNFGTAVASTPSPIVLNCTPVNNAVTVTITPAANSQPVISGNSLTFTPALTAGTVVHLHYLCP